MKLSIKAKVIIMSVLFVLVFGPSTAFLLMNLTRVVRSFEKSVGLGEHVLARAYLLSKLIVDLETGQRGFVITGREEFLEPYIRANEEFDYTLRRLKQDLSDYPGHLENLEKIGRLRYVWEGVAGEPEIKARRLVEESKVDLKAIYETILAGVGKKILDRLRLAMDEIATKLKKAGRKDELILITMIAKDVVDSETGERGFLLAGEDRFLEPYYEGQVKFNADVKELKEMFEGDEENLERLSVVRALYEEWLLKAARPEINLRVKYENDPRSMDDVAALLGEGTGKKVIDELRRLTGHFIDTLAKDVKAHLTQAKREAAHARLLGLSVTGGGIFLLITVSFFLGRSIVKPIGILCRATEKLGQGDYSHRINVKSSDEFEVLADSFNSMSQKLKASRDDLVRAKDFSDNIMKSMIDTLIVVDGDSTVLLINQATLSLLGYERDELIGKSVGVIFAEDPENTTAQKLAEENGPQDVEVRYQAKDGTVIPMSLNKSVMREPEGKLAGAVYVARDISELRRLIEEAAEAAAERKKAADLRQAFEKLDASHQQLIKSKQELEKEITERKRTERELQESEAAVRKSQEDLRILAGRLISAQEDERRRLARELHDDLTQRLAVLAIDAGILEQHSDSCPDLIREKLPRMKEQIVRLSGDIHRISRQLHPSILDDLGLVDAIKSLCTGFSNREGLSVEFTPENLPEVLPKDLSLCLYRITQESLRNVAKHARAKEAHVTLAGNDGDVLLSIQDSGVGFDLAQVRGKPGLGLASMEERVRLIQGSLSVQSQPTQGTTIEVRAPLARGDG